jgi:uncharacterized membrane protein
MKHRMTKRLAAAAAATALALCATVLPASSAQADSSWGRGIVADSQFLNR